MTSAGGLLQSVCTPFVVVVVFVSSITASNSIPSLLVLLFTFNDFFALSLRSSSPFQHVAYKNYQPFVFVLFRCVCQRVYKSWQRVEWSRRYDSTSTASHNSGADHGSNLVPRRSPFASGAKEEVLGTRLIPMGKITMFNGSQQWTVLFICNYRVNNYRTPFTHGMGKGRGGGAVQKIQVDEGFSQ